MTQRTKAELDVLFADNTSGLITPSRMRDFVDSTRPSQGALHFADNLVVTDILTQNVFAKASNPATLQPSALRFSMPSLGRLQYDGITSVWARIWFVGSVSATSANEIVKLAIGTNGTPLVPSYMRTKLGGSGDVQAIACMADVLLDPGDYLEMFLANETSTTDILIEHGYMSALGFLT